MLKRFTQRQQPVASPAAADSIPLMDMSAYSLRERSDTVAEHDERVEHDEQPAAPPPPLEASGFDQVGTHVAAVLQAAQESADRIVAGARERAAKLVESAAAQAKQRLDEVRAEEERISSEVARIRGEAESYAAARRADVENEMRALRGEAEREARELREAAEELADRLEREARERQAQLRQLEGEIEERLRAAWDTARDVGTRIGSLLDGRRAPEDEPTRRDASAEESQAVSSGA